MDDFNSIVNQHNASQSANHIKNLRSLTIAIGSAIAMVTLLLLLTSTPAIAALPHWHYGGAENPTQWGSLSEDFALCKLGKQQSPINISLSGKISGKDKPEVTPPKINFDYKSSPLAVVNNGHTIQVNYAQGSSASIDGEKFSLLQFHFHTPSEHTIDSKASAMELHLVHRSEAGKLAVVAVMLSKGKSNSLIDEVWQNIPDVGKTNAVSDRMINAADLLPSNQDYVSYDGSLTTPPCSEGVKWNIFVNPITISEAQIETFEKIYQVDARPIQPTNNRTVQLHRD